ncbi:MAG TPA: (Fe-S)-binding protein [Actinomycetota bacterium]|nr:(Fe-S)-binding protein [Actinomycetota bacterium]
MNFPRPMGDAPRRAALFATCLVDLVAPQVAEATAALLRDAGLDVEVPLGQTCCGQPWWTSGYPEEARRVARRALDAFEDAGAVVVPSGSCAAMVRASYARLFAGTDDEGRARDLARRTHELSSFFVDVLGTDGPGGRFEGRVAYHDGCHGLRELGLGRQARRLLAGVEGLELVEIDPPVACCGFGGTFSLRLPGLAEAMADDELARIEAAGADAVASGDPGCLLHLGGRASRRGSALRFLHLAELLASARGLR